LDFRYIHIYSGNPTEALDVRAVARKIAEMFRNCDVDIRPDFFGYWNIKADVELARIKDIKQTFENQPNCKYDCNMIPLYDGFVLQHLFADLISDSQRYFDHLHIIFTNLLTSTFNYDDWRYHGRTLICGTPSIISTTGIIEAPAKPREFYISQYGGFADISTLKKRFADRFIDYGDDRITSAAIGYVLQAIFFFITDGDPFCENRNCRLFNSHWQEDLIRTQILRPMLCNIHQKIMNKFNKK
jgi:hypothetical protein